MTTRMTIACVSCLLLFSVAGSAQEEAANRRLSPLQRQFERSGTRTIVRFSWDGSIAGDLNVRRDSALRQAWNISDEQYQEIEDIQRGDKFAREFFQRPEVRSIMEEENQYMRSTAMQNADEETRAIKSAEFHEKRMVLLYTLQADAIENILTAEQKRKIQEYQLATMERMPFVSPRMFEALDLTDGQRQEMERIKKKLEPEFEKLLENHLNNQQIIADKIFEERKRQGDGIDIMVIHEKLLKEDPEYKKIDDESSSAGKAFAIQFKTEMFEVLTDEQWLRLQALVDNPPDYIKAIYKREEDRKKQAGAWQPGPNSWQPGDAIPEQYRQERNAKRQFPRGE